MDRVMTPSVARALTSAAVFLAIFTVGPRADAAPELVFDATKWRTLPSESGPDNYYTRVDDPTGPYIRAHYKPPMKTTVLAVQIPEDFKQGVKKIRWSWRAVTLPKGGDECAKGREDSAAVVYVLFKRGLRYHTLKYVWSGVGQRGRVCDRKRNPFARQDTIILESGASGGAWRTEEIDPAADYRRYLENDPTAEVPDFVGMGIMSDGDQTNSESVADYGTVTLVK
jgi:hypothetical protein